MAAEWRVPRLRVDADGDWYDGDGPITHPGILANLRANLRSDGEGYFIQTRVRIPVTVEDAPFVVTRVERRSERLRAWLNDGTEEDLDPTRLRIGAGAVPYCDVKGGRFPARFSRPATFQLLSLAEYDERTGRGTVRLGGREWTLERPA
jgi:hypothetical protein